MNVAVNTLCPRLRTVSYVWCIIAILMTGHAAIANIKDAEPNISAIRKSLISAVNSGKTTDSLYQQLEVMNNKTPLITGYMGTLQALKAKHSWNPYNKIKYIKNCEKTFQMAVHQDPHNIEIRFMRFSVEHNVPSFLGYNKNLGADKAEIIRQLDKGFYAQADTQLVRTIIKFLLDSKRCTAAETRNLNQHLAAL